jgi:RHS repeat-associated protein
MIQPGRKFSIDNYRYGFNGKENDNDVKGEGNQQDYGMRIYDPRLGKFLSVDPLTKKYPELTPYQFASNRPIDGVDLDGAEFKHKTTYYFDGWSVTEFNIVIKVKNSSTIMTDAQVWTMANAMKAGIEQAYTKKFLADKVETKATVTFVKDNNADPKKDYYFDFIDIVSNGSSYTAGQATGGIGASNVNKMNISGTLNGAILSTIPTRTAAHEIGHTGGLEHPHDPHGPNLDPKTEAAYKAGLIPDNLMIWSSKGGTGDGLTIDQYKMLMKTIDKNNTIYVPYISEPYSKDLPVRMSTYVKPPALIRSFNSNVQYTMAGENYIKPPPPPKPKP